VIPKHPFAYLHRGDNFINTAKIYTKSIPGRLSETFLIRGTACLDCVVTGTKFSRNLFAATLTPELFYRVQRKPVATGACSSTTVKAIPSVEC